MKLSNQIPAIYQKIHEKFGVNWSRGVIITYGDTAYCKWYIGLRKVVHEQVHVEQQTMRNTTPDKWWENYFNDPNFRLEQEVEAYRMEMKHVRRTVKDRNEVFRILREICLDLSSPMYGNICTFEEAKKFLNI